MSQGAFVIADGLNIRARRNGVPATTASLKKFTKVCVSRSARRSAGKQLVKEVSLMASPEALRDMSSDELELYADMFLADSPSDRNIYADEEPLDDNALILSASEHDELPATLVGSLPDWMLAELTAAKGDAFVSLSLFESKRLSPRAAISMVDEPLYA
jgi:hypothetical protein